VRVCVRSTLDLFISSMVNRQRLTSSTEDGSSPETSCDNPRRPRQNSPEIVHMYIVERENRETGHFKPSVIEIRTVYRRTITGKVISSGRYKHTNNSVMYIIGLDDLDCIVISGPGYTAAPRRLRLQWPIEVSLYYIYKSKASIIFKTVLATGT